jgi:hypothetical protein
MRVQGGANMNNSESWKEAYESWLEHLALAALGTDSAMWCVCGASPEPSPPKPTAFHLRKCWCAAPRLNQLNRFALLFADGEVKATPYVERYRS